MSNNYCEGSSLLKLPKKLHKKAQKIIDRVSSELENGDEGYCGVVAEMTDDGVWFHADENLNPEHMEIIARAVIEELKIDEPFYASWCYTCSKQRIDEFGGGAFAIKRGHDTFWVDAMSLVQEHKFVKS